MEYISVELENIVGKGENATSIFSFPTMFS